MKKGAVPLALYVIAGVSILYAVLTLIAIIEDAVERACTP